MKVPEKTINKQNSEKCEDIKNKERKVIIKIRNSQMENESAIEIIKAKEWFFENINKIDNQLAQVQT